MIARLAPFLKLYAHYTSGFEDAMKLLTHWTKKEKKFDVVVKAFEVEERGSEEGREQGGIQGRREERSEKGSERVKEREGCKRKANLFCFVS